MNTRESEWNDADLNVKRKLRISRGKIKREKEKKAYILRAEYYRRQRASFRVEMYLPLQMKWQSPYQLIGKVECVAFWLV